MQTRSRARRASKASGRPEAERVATAPGLFDLEWTALRNIISRLDLRDTVAFAACSTKCFTHVMLDHQGPKRVWDTYGGGSTYDTLGRIAWQVRVDTPERVATSCRLLRRLKVEYTSHWDFARGYVGVSGLLMRPCYMYFLTEALETLEPSECTAPGILRFLEQAERMYAVEVLKYAPSVLSLGEPTREELEWGGGVPFDTGDPFGGGRPRSVTDFERNATAAHKAWRAIERLPGDMTCLKKLDVSGAKHLAVDFLPRSSRASLKVLDASRSNVRGIPAGCEQLQWVALRECPLQFKEVPGCDMFPEDSVKNVRVLDVAGVQTWNLFIPAYFEHLKEVNVSGCMGLHHDGSYMAEGWSPMEDDDNPCWLAPLPKLERVLANGTNIQEMPDLSMLEELHFDDNEAMYSDWSHPDAIPLSFDDSWMRLRKLTLNQTAACKLPEDLEDLEELDIGYIRCEDGEDGQFHVPASSCANIRVLRTTTMGLTCLTADFASLEELYIADDDYYGTRPMWSAPANQGFESDSGDESGAEGSAESCVALPPEVAGRLKVLSVAQCPSLRDVPEGMSSLETLKIGTCQRLRADWLPPSSRKRLRELRLHRTGVSTLPHLPRLQRLELSNESAYDATESLPNDLPAAVRAHMTELSLPGTPVSKLPAGFSKLEILDVSGSHALCDDFLPADSRGRLATLNASSSNLRVVPDGLRGLANLDVKDCGALHATDWLPQDSVGALRVLKASGASVGTLPGGMHLLQELDVSRTRVSGSRFIPKCSRAKVERLDVTRTSIRRIPDDMHSLAELHIDEPAAGWDEAKVVPASSQHRLQKVSFAPMVTKDPWEAFMI
ncbi:unnamed protein product [Pedinophyceae sp. YPF-701]|nr:unnamed protein product [Pedinophyceae sp. YPF-701]